MGRSSSKDDIFCYYSITLDPGYWLVFVASWNYNLPTEKILIYNTNGNSQYAYIEKSTYNKPQKNLSTFCYFFSEAWNNILSIAVSHGSYITEDEPIDIIAFKI